MSELTTPTVKIINFSAKLLAVLLSVFLFVFIFPDISHHLVLLIGGGMTLYSLRYLKRYGDLQSWLLEKAKILSIQEEIDEEPAGNGRSIKYIIPKIQYQYQIDGKTYLSEQVSLEKQNIWCAEVNIWGESLAEHEKWWSALKVGYELSAYINPNNPNDAILIRNLRNSRRSHHLAILIGGILICLLWILLALLKS